MIKITEKLFAVSDEEGFVRVYNVENMVLIHEMKAHNNVVRDLKLSFENKLVSVGKDKTINIWE